MLLRRWLDRPSLRRSFAHRSPQDRRPRATRPIPVEVLEDRLLLAAFFSPADVRQAYNIDNINFGSIKGDGTGQTVAIVDAFDSPNVLSDFMAFNAAFGLPNTDGNGNFALEVQQPQGVPDFDFQWAPEISLDTQWVHAIAPGAHIILVEAIDNSFTNLLDAVDYARNLPGVSVVSMSFGSVGEFSSETSLDHFFQTPDGHQGVSFIASSGDAGSIIAYPSVSPNVLSVGGTSLFTSGSRTGQEAWISAGGGVSLYEPKPAYQASVTQSKTQRTVPDVSMVADPITGVSIFLTDPFGGIFFDGLMDIGGTSASCPMWAGLVAIANQGRDLKGLDSLDGPTELLPAIYNLPASDFTDITKGFSLSLTVPPTPPQVAIPGYDLVTGRGTPLANTLVPHLAEVGEDDPRMVSVVVSAQSDDLTYGTSGTTTYDVTVTRSSAGGTFDVDLSLLGGLPPGVTFAFDVGGTATNTLHFASGDQSLTATLSITSADRTAAGSLPFTIQAERLDNTTGDPTGDFVTGNGALVITPRVLNVTATGVNKIYDATILANATFTDDRLPGDVFTVTGTGAFADPNVGVGKTVTVTGIVLSGPAAGNYQVASTTATTTASITPRSITVLAVPRTKYVGDPDPALTFQVVTGSLAGSDQIAGQLTRDPGETVGTYGITQGTLDAGANYSMGFVGSTLTIQPFGAGFDLSGPWVFGGKLVQITQAGGNLSFVDENLTLSTGAFGAKDIFTGRGGLTGTVDLSTPDQGRVVWSDGEIWLRLQLGGQYFNPANGKLTSLQQTGLNLTFINANGGSTAGTIVSPTQVSLPGWGQTATFVDGKLLFANGTQWTKLDLSPSWFSSNAAASVGVIQNGTTSLTFVNRLGATSAGYWLNPTTVFASDWNSTGTVVDGRISWNGGQTLWYKRTTVWGASSGQGQVSLTMAAASNQFFVTNRTGGSSRAVVTSPTTITLLDWGVTGTRSGGRILWSNGTVWDNFDFNALDALFSDLKTFPFAGA